MGGTASTDAVNSISQTISTIASNTVQSCIVDTTQSQTVNITNAGLSVGGSIGASQTTAVSSQCFSNASMQSQLQNQIISAISQASSSNSVALLSAFGSTNASALANLTNLVQNNVTMSNIQTNYNNIMQAQTVNFTNKGVTLFQNIDVTQGAQVFAAATLQEVDNAGILTAISNTVAQKSAATSSNPLDFITSALSSISSDILYGVIFFMILVALIIGGGFYFFSSAAGSASGAVSGLIS